MGVSLKLARIGRACVACGTCVPVCPRAAIDIHAGVSARVDAAACVGCGKCAAVCPAAVISVTPREVPV